jgi:hypothetical protein
VRRKSSGRNLKVTVKKNENEYAPSPCVDSSVKVVGGPGAGFNFVGGYVRNGEGDSDCR